MLNKAVFKKDTDLDNSVLDEVELEEIDPAISGLESIFKLVFEDSMKISTERNRSLRMAFADHPRKNWNLMLHIFGVPGNDSMVRISLKLMYGTDDPIYNVAGDLENPLDDLLKDFELEEIVDNQRSGLKEE